MPHLLATLVLLLFAWSSGLPAQKSDKSEFLVPIPDKIERPTKADEAGLLQWEPHKADRCVNCKGRQVMVCLHCERFDKGDTESCPECKNKQEATCRICAGTGQMPDVLKQAPCPTCFGAALTRCFVCNGRGRFPVAGGGGKPQKCDCCDGIGAFKCQTCDGKRFVETPALKPSMADGKVADLKKAIANAEELSAALDKWTTTQDGRKDAKAFDKLVGLAKFFPALKKTGKHFDEISKKQAKGAVWKHYGETVGTQLETTKQALDYYLKHQKRILELSLARAEHNEAKAAETKSGKR